MAKTERPDKTPLFEVEIKSGGRAVDTGERVRPEPVTLSPARQAAKERARRRNILLAAGAVGFLIMLGAWMWFTSPLGGVPADAVARVNGEFIYQRDVEQRMGLTRLFNELSARPDAEEPTATNALEQIISDLMQVQDARKAGVTAAAEEIDAELANIETSTGRTREQLEEAAGRYNLTLDDLRGFVADALVIKKYKDEYVLAGAADVQDATNKENEWFTQLANTSRIDRYKPVGSGPAPRVGAEAPDFTLTDIDGSEVTLSSLRGKPVMVNFWATWCPPCRAEIPEIVRLYTESAAGERPYEVLGVATQSDSA
ncbi:MAG TPA: redoxin domain-containing protein, partial [Chloroflexia bacterium]|nr:redoxin domain-containing protein [Chloroflexia bacterium]